MASTLSGDQACGYEQTWVLAVAQKAGNKQEDEPPTNWSGEE